MKRSGMLLLIFAALLVVVACSNETKSISQNDDMVAADDIVVIPDEDTVITVDETADTMLLDDGIIPDDEPIVDETVVPDETPFETIGDFALDFQGQVNVNLSDYTKIKGGKGTVNFNYRGTPYSFGELTVIIVKLFPLAILQQNNVAVMWLESAPGLGAETKKVFAITFPSTIQPGQYVMETAQAYAFYGDIDINLQGGQFNIKCVRAAGYQGNITVNSYTGTAADFLANGLLVDPAAAASQLPYPVCVD